MLRTTGPEYIAIRKVMDTETIVNAQKMAKAVVIADEMLDYAVDLISATTDGAEG